MQVQNHVGGGQVTSHLSPQDPPSALPGGRAPDGQWPLLHRPKKEAPTDPVHTPTGSLSGAGGGTVCVYYWMCGRSETCLQN